MNVFFDVLDTLINENGDPRPHAREVFLELAGMGHDVYLWSSGGGSYAARAARVLGVEADLCGTVLPAPVLVIHVFLAGRGQRLFRIARRLGQGPDGTAGTGPTGIRSRGHHGHRKSAIIGREQPGCRRSLRAPTTPRGGPDGGGGRSALREQDRRPSGREGRPRQRAATANRARVDPGVGNGARKGLVGQRPGQTAHRQIHVKGRGRGSHLRSLRRPRRREARGKGGKRNARLPRAPVRGWGG